MKTYAVDFETSYTDTRGIRQLGVRNYLSHPETDIFMVSVYGDDFAWVGHPKEFDWQQLGVSQLVSHNAAFDREVFAEIERRGGDQFLSWHQWDCSADLAAFLQSPRSLLDASRELLGIKLDKGVRDEMKGKDFHTLSAEDKVRWAEYAMLDAKACHALWQQHSHKWPEHERAVSRHTAMMGARGLGIDLAAVERGIEILMQTVWTCAQRIPWHGQLDARGKEIPITSPKEIVATCRRLGIEPPASTDGKSEEFEAWLEEHEDKADFVLAIQEYRRANRVLCILQEMAARTVGGRLRQGLVYFGAPHTGHWSGGGGDEERSKRQTGLNLLNLPRDPLFITPDFRLLTLRRLSDTQQREVLKARTLDGVPLHVVDLRAVLNPGPDKRLIISDWSAVQARVARWLAGDEVMLEMLRNGVDIYEAHARTSMGYADPRPLKEVDKAKRQLAKMRELQLQFQCGADKFVKSSWTQYQYRISLPDAKRNVDSYRRANRKITGCWDQLDRAFKASVGGDFHCTLPSGRTISYFGVARSAGGRFGTEYTARVKRGGDRLSFYGGKLFQNLVAGTSRDLLADVVLRQEAAGLPVVLHVHDETVNEVDVRDVEEAKHEAYKQMTTLPEWAEGLPIESEVVVSEFYTK